MSPLFQHVAQKQGRSAAADDLVETLEIMQEACDWASDLNWSKAQMKHYFRMLRDDLGYCIDQVLSLRAFEEAEAGHG